MQHRRKASQPVNNRQFKKTKSNCNVNVADVSEGPSLSDMDQEDRNISEQSNLDIDSEVVDSPNILINK